VAAAMRRRGSHLRATFAIKASGLNPVQKVLDRVLEDGRIELVQDARPVSFRGDEFRVTKHRQVP
jgi:hypothetical protein